MFYKITSIENGKVARWSQVCS